MRQLLSVSLVAVGVVLFNPAPALAQDSTDAPVLTREQQEIFLRTAEIQDVEELSVGVTNSQQATLSDATLTHLAHLQDVDIFRPEFRPASGRTEINFRDKAEIACVAARAALIVEHFENLIAEKGAGQVLFGVPPGD